jgi:hypothetical protein
MLQLKEKYKTVLVSTNESLRDLKLLMIKLGDYRYIV